MSKSYIVQWGKKESIHENITLLLKKKQGAFNTAGALIRIATTVCFGIARNYFKVIIILAVS